MNAKNYNDWYSTPFGKYAHELEKKLVLNFIGEVKGKKILDVGCGTGIYAIELAKLGAEVVGIDNSEEILNFAKEKLEKINGETFEKDNLKKLEGNLESQKEKSKLKVNFILGNAENLPFVNNSFDIVISILSLCFIKEHKKALAEMKRVAKEKVVIAVLNKNSLYYFQKRNSPSYKNARFYTINDFNDDNITKFKTTVFAMSFFPKFLLKFFYKIDNTLSFFNCGAFLILERRTTIQM